MRQMQIITNLNYLKRMIKCKVLNLHHIYIYSHFTCFNTLTGKTVWKYNLFVSMMWKKLKCTHQLIKYQIYRCECINIGFWWCQSRIKQRLLQQTFKG